jgi:hypothetical protein
LPESEVIAAYGAAMVAAFQVLINCLEESDALLPGQFPHALGVYMEMVKSNKGDVNDMTLQCSTTSARLRWINYPHTTSGGTRTLDAVARNP